MSIIDNKEQTKRIETLAKTIETLDQRVVQSEITMVDRLETRLNIERLEQNKRFEKFERLLMLQGARADEGYNRISADTNLIAKCMSDTNRQAAQTSLDMNGIRNKLNTLVMDVQATGQEAIISPETTPYKMWANYDNKNTIKDKTGSPLLGVAGTEC